MRYAATVLLLFFLLAGCATGPKYYAVDSASINNKTIFSGMSIDKVTDIAGEPDSVRSISPSTVKMYTGERLSSYTILKYGQYRITFKNGMVSKLEKL